jgi:hypothetical protein
MSLGTVKTNQRQAVRGDLRGLSAGSTAGADAVNQVQRRGERGGSRMSLERTVGLAKNA